MTKTFSPRPYQSIITNYIISNPRCAVWAEMGTGKTTATLHAIDQALTLGYDKPVLVLAPLLVARTTWPDEARKWSNFNHLEVVPIVGNEAQRLKLLKSSPNANIFTTNYEQLPWLVSHYGGKWPFEWVVADESTRLKNFRLKQGGKRAQALARVAHSKVKRFTELTGTPSPNGLLDLWGQMWMLDGGRRLGRSFTAFKARWFKEDRTRFTCEPHPFASREINALIADLCLTIKAKDWFDIREPIVVNETFDLDDYSRELYDEMEDKFYIELEGYPVEAVHAAARSQKLLQLTAGAAYTDSEVDLDDGPEAPAFEVIHDDKIRILESIIEEASGAPVLVAFNFRSDLKRLMKAFPHAVHLNPRNVNEVLPAWNKGKIPILLAHPASAGHGISLQDGGNILVFFGVNWNLEQHLQIIERIGPTRQLQSGYDRPVFIYNILANDTIDELVLERIETKKAVQDLLMEAMNKRRRNDNR